jgi:uncharacterized protein
MTENSKSFDPMEMGLTDDDFSHELLVRSIVTASGGQVLGRIKLQKLVFLLDKLGLESGFKYSYHHYGPYSEELSTVTETAKIFNLIQEKFALRKSDGARYSVFEPTSSNASSVKSEFLSRQNIVNAINEINSINSTVVELAATAYWLKFEERDCDWRKEIVRRKGPKVEGGRLEKALALLLRINLPIVD